MNKLKRSARLPLLSAMFHLILVPPVSAEGLTSDAGTFRDAAAQVYQEGVDVCGGVCEPELADPLQNLGTSIQPLSDAISSGDQQRIRNAINNTAVALSSICTALRTDCPAMPLGAVAKLKNDNDDEISIDGCADMQACLRGCDDDYRWCIRDITQAQQDCINQYVGCRLQTPFCDYRGSPFDAATFNNCLATSYYHQLLLVHGRDCRCPVPPGVSERSGGCPDFFSQPPGQISTAVCEVGDGQGCARCCNSKCSGMDSRLSCVGDNREECDVCEWSRRTLLAGTSMRASLCFGRQIGSRGQCDAAYAACSDGCYRMWF